MAANDDLDDFFKKKDRKGNKHKKQTGLLTNNEELLKQLVIVTSATSAFKENLEFDEEEEDEVSHPRPRPVDETNGTSEVIDDAQTMIQKSQPSSSTVTNKSKSNSKLTVQDNNHIPTGENEQQDEWEEFEGANSNYNQLRLKFARGTNDPNTWDDNDDHEDYDDDGHPANIQTDENGNEIEVNDNHSSTRTTNRRTKEKQVWNIDQLKASQTLPTSDAVDSSGHKVEEQAVSAPKPATSSAYRPPQLRGNSTVQIVSGGQQRTSKKEKPNLASTEEFPSLGAAVNKK